MICSCPIYSLKSALKLISNSSSLDFLKNICSGLIPKKTSLLSKLDFFLKSYPFMGISIFDPWVINETLFELSFRLPLLNSLMENL